MKKNKVRGFTLIELLTVIAILAIILLLALPTILNGIGKGKVKLRDNQISLIVKGAEKYAAQYYNTLDWIDDGSRQKAVVTLRELNEKGFVDLPVIDPVTNEEFDPDNTYVTVYKDKDGNVTFVYGNGGLLTVNSKNQTISQSTIYNEDMILSDVYAQDEEGNNIKDEHVSLIMKKQTVVFYQILKKN